MDINTILEDLKDGKNPRTQASLDKLNQTLQAYYEAGHRDFSITTIGRVSGEEGGVGYNSIRATKNAHFRKLIEAWATKAFTTLKKPLAKHSRSRHIPQDNQLLERIPDPAVRALFGQIIAERNRYRKEVNLIKQHANIVIDKRPVRQFEAEAENNQVEVLPSMSGMLIPLEVKALQYAISDECLINNGWITTKHGQVKSEEYQDEIFPRGYMTALKKILGEIDKEQ